MVASHGIESKERPGRRRFLRKAVNASDHDVDPDIFEPVDAVHPRALDRHLAFERHAERGEKSDRGCKVVVDDAEVVQSLDRHLPSIAEAVRGGSGRPFSRVGRG